MHCAAAHISDATRSAHRIAAGAATRSLNSLGFTKSEYAARHPSNHDSVRLSPLRHRRLAKPRLTRIGLPPAELPKRRDAASTMFSSAISTLIHLDQLQFTSVTPSPLTSAPSRNGGYGIPRPRGAGRVSARHPNSHDSVGLTWIDPATRRSPQSGETPLLLCSHLRSPP
jgi:hypothetical protein